MYIILSMILSGNIVLIIFFALKKLLTKYFDFGLQNRILKMSLIFFIVPLSLIIGFIRLISYLVIGSNPEFPYHIKAANPTIIFKSDYFVTNSVIHTMGIVFAIWLILACTLFGYYICSYLKFKRIIYASAESMQNDYLRSFLSEQAKALNIKRNIRLFNSNALGSAHTMGMFKPVIFLPVGYNNTEQQIMILHELKHIKNHDMAAKLLCFICKGLYWFNPFMYPLSRFLNQTAELACDEWVAQQLDVDQKPIYAQLIISMSSKKTVTYKYSTLFTGNYELIQERIDCIMNKTPKNKMRQFLAMILSMIAIVLSSIPAFAGPPLQLLTIDHPDPASVISFRLRYDIFYSEDTVDSIKEQECPIAYDGRFDTIDGKIYDAADVESHATFNCTHYTKGTIGSWTMYY